MYIYLYKPCKYKYHVYNIYTPYIYIPSANIAYMYHTYIHILEESADLFPTTRCFTGSCRYQMASSIHYLHNRRKGRRVFVGPRESQGCLELRYKNILYIYNIMYIYIHGIYIWYIYSLYIYIYGIYI